MSGTIYCFSGPSGSGKTTLADILRWTSKGQISRITTVTTRKPRSEEVDGIDYHFWSEEHFRRGIADHMFFEHEEVHGNLYGTLKGSLEEVIHQGQSAVIILDVYGAIKLKDTFPDNTVNVFLTCSTRAELRRRIEERGTLPEEVTRRLSRASKEHQTYSSDHRKFDYLIINDDLSTSRLALLNITAQQAVRAGKSLTFEDDVYG